MTKRRSDGVSIKVRKEFAVRLKAIRISAGYKFAKTFAEELGMEEPETYRRWERGETEPNLFHLKSIRRLTGVDLNFLISGWNVEETEELIAIDRPLPRRKSSRSP